MKKPLQGCKMGQIYDWCTGNCYVAAKKFNSNEMNKEHKSQTLTHGYSIPSSEYELRNQQSYQEW